MDDIFQLLVSGVAFGCVYGMVALGFVLIYKATEMVNFAQGEFMMIGAFIAISLSGIEGMPYLGVFVLTVLIMFVLGMFLERSIIRPMIGESPFAVLMLTIGLGFVLRAVAGVIWGHEPHQLNTPYNGLVWDTAWFRLDFETMVIGCGTVVICALIYLFFRFSRLGIAMQAASQNQLAAYYVGIPVQRVVSFTWGLSAAIAAITGILVAPLWWIEPSIGFVGLIAFVAAIVGGFGSLPGALVGGILIGIVQQFAEYYWPDQFGEGWGTPAVYIVLLLVLLVRPQGLIATLQKKKV